MHCQHHNEILEQKCRQALCEETDAITKCKCLFLKCGCHTIASIGRKFKIMDDDRNRKLDFEEFLKGCHEVLGFSRNTDVQILKNFFEAIDKDGSGGIDFNEFLTAIRPSMSKFRIEIVKKAFARMDNTEDGVVTVDDIKGFYNAKEQSKYKNGEWLEEEVFFMEFIKNFQDTPNMNEPRTAIVQEAFALMDRTGDGVVTVDDMIGVYNAKEHPKYKNGEWTENQVFLEFLKNFQVRDDSGDPNKQKVTRDEWTDYFRGISASIDNDAYFDLMMKKCWFSKKPAKPAERADKFW